MRPLRFHKTAFVCIIITVLLASTASIGSGQTTNTASNTQKYVVFRCDDVTLKADFAELQAIDQVHIEKDVPLTLGIIPHPTPGTGDELLSDSQFLSYMRALASNHLFEFAQHGYTHQGTSVVGPSEFYGRPYAVQYGVIKQGRSDIRKAFGVTPTSFIPPFDSSDNNTLKAAKALGFTEYSTSFRDLNINEGTRQGMHVEAASLELANESLQSAENKTEQFLTDTHSIDTFVVLYHVADFRSPDGSVNQERLRLLENYIDYLKERGDVQFTRLDHSLTTGGVHPTPVTNDAQNVQQNPIVFPVNETNSALIEGLGGPFIVLLAGTTLVLLLGGAYLILSHRGSKRRPKNRKLR
ncbi:MAG: DUF2334 domain-containing protein [Halobacteriota archaeon]